MITKTGVGYIKNYKGQIIAKFDLPKGEHPDTPGMTYYDAPDREALKDIEIYEEPLTQEQITEQKIQAEIKVFVREEAIKRLKTKGEI